MRRTYKVIGWTWAVVSTLSLVMLAARVWDGTILMAIVSIVLVFTSLGPPMVYYEATREYYE